MVTSTRSVATAETSGRRYLVCIAPSYGYCSLFTDLLQCAM